MNFLSNSMFLNNLFLKPKYGYMILFIAIIAISLFNFIIITSVSFTHNQILQAKDYEHQLRNFSNIIKTAEIKTNYVKRILQEGNAPLQLIDDTTILGISMLLKSETPKMVLLVEQLAPYDLNEFKQITSQAIIDCDSWVNNKNLDTLMKMYGSILKVQFFADSVISTLTQKISSDLYKSEKQIEMIRIFSLSLNFIILMVLMILILPPLISKSND